jgi:hypothetical protein
MLNNLNEEIRNLPGVFSPLQKILETEPHRSDRFEVGFGLATP